MHLHFAVLFFLLVCYEFVTTIIKGRKTLKISHELKLLRRTEAFKIRQGNSMKFSLNFQIGQVITCVKGFRSILSLKIKICFIFIYDQILKNIGNFTIIGIIKTKLGHSIFQTASIMFRVVMKLGHGVMHELHGSYIVFAACIYLSAYK